MSRFFTLLLGGLLFTSLGCGGVADRPDLGDVSGTVTMDGKPLSGAEVSFSPEQGRSSLGKTDAEGHYTLNYMPNVTGAKVGMHTVSIYSGSQEEAEVDDPNAPPAPKEAIPARYNTQSELTFDVKPGDNVADFKLTSK